MAGSAEEAHVRIRFLRRCRNLLDAREHQPTPNLPNLHSQSGRLSARCVLSVGSDGHRQQSIKVTVCDPILKAGKRGELAVLQAIFIALALAVMLGKPEQVRAQTPGPPELRELVIGTKVAPPFAMRADDGTWHGISIDLWRRIANQTHLRYRFQETTLKGLTEGVADGSLDAGVAALTVTGRGARWSISLNLSTAPASGLRLHGKRVSRGGPL